MTDSLKASARDGNPKAIEALMNKSFESKGLTVRVTNSGPLLKVVVRGKETPDKTLLPLIKRGIASINPTGFDKVIVTANAIGKRVSWSEQWELSGSTTAAPAPASSPLLPPPNVDILAGRVLPVKWYQKNWVIISLLIFFPPGGIAFAWTSQWPKAGKIGASFISGLWLLSLLVQQPKETQPTTAQEDAQSPTTELIAETEAPENEAPTPVVDRTFADAVNQAIAASEASQAASSKDDWDNAANLWDSAISQMKSVPASNASYATAQLKVGEYQQNLDYAKDRSITLLPNLGVNKSDIRYVFSQLNVDFLFKDAPLTDGTPRLLGTSRDNFVMMELYGSTNLVTKATMMTFIGKGVPADLQALYNVSFLDKVAPGYDWNAQLSETLNEISASNFEDFSEKETFQAGDKIVSVSLSEFSGIAVLLVSVEPD